MSARIIDNGLAIAWDIRRLRNQSVFDEFPNLSGPFLICAIGNFLRLSQAASDFVDSHSDGYFVSRDKFVDDPPAFFALLEIASRPSGRGSSSL